MHADSLASIMCAVGVSESAHGLGAHHRCEVVRKRAQHELEKAGTRLHLVQGFLKAMADLDQVRSTLALATFHTNKQSVSYATI